MSAQYASAKIAPIPLPEYDVAVFIVLDGAAPRREASPAVSELVDASQRSLTINT
jgi:hypothetical protein